MRVRFNSENMRAATLLFWIFQISIIEINSEITIDLVYRKINDLEIEIATLKVLIFVEAKIGEPASKRIEKCA